MLSLSLVQQRVQRIESLTLSDPATARQEERRLLFDVLWFVAEESYFEGGSLAREAMKLEKSSASSDPVRVS